MITVQIPTEQPAPGTIPFPSLAERMVASRTSLAGDTPRTLEGYGFTAAMAAAARAAADVDDATGRTATYLPPRAMTPEEHITFAMRIAARAVITDIETMGIKCVSFGETHYDIRMMLDDTQFSPEAVEINLEHIAYAFEAGVIVAHPTMNGLVRVIVPAGL